MKIQIITPDGVLRNSDLQIKIPCAEVFKGFDGRLEKLDQNGRINQKYNRKVLGRELSSTQAGCVLSHYQAQISNEDNWLCILEDDAVILDSAKLIEALDIVSKLKFNYPVIILLYAGYGGLYGNFRSVTDNFSLGKVVSLPTGTVGYVINYKCSKLISSHSSITGAPDWPTWSADVSFFQLYPAVVSHSPHFNSIYLEVSKKSDSLSWPKHRLTSVRTILALFNPNITSAYGGPSSYARIVLFPGMRRKIWRLRYDAR